MSLLFEKLRAYQLAKELVSEILQYLELWPTVSAKLIDQLQRSATSISGNIAEGAGRTHIKERQQFFGYALGSLNESFSYLEVAVLKGWLARQELDRQRPRFEVLAKMIKALASSTLAADLNKPSNGTGFKSRTANLTADRTAKASATANPTANQKSNQTANPPANPMANPTANLTTNPMAN